MFTGRAYDTETGLYYYRARYYDPYIGRFLQTDPIGYADSMNLYVYVGNNPIIFADPSGLCGEGYWGGGKYGQIMSQWQQADAAWLQVFQGERMTSALLDRLTHHCHIFEMNGESYRFKQSVQKGKLKNK